MTDQQRELLESWVRAKTTPQRVAFRAKICLLAADGMSATDIAHHVGASRPTVLLWKKRFDEQGPEGLTKDAPRGPSPRRLDDDTRQAIVDATLNSASPDAAQWTTRTLAKALGVSNATVARIWKALKIAPKKKKGARPSKEDHAKQRSAELMGVYLTGPLKAFVVSIAGGPSEWNPVGRPGLPGNLRPDRGSLDTGGECRSCLSTTIDMLDGAARGLEYPAPSLNGLEQFLWRVTDQTEVGTEHHVFLDAKESEMRALTDAGLASGKRWQGHILPQGLSAVDDIAKAIERRTGVPSSPGKPLFTQALKRAIQRCLEYQHAESTPFVWTKNLASDDAHPSVCKVMLETVRHLAALVATLGMANPGTRDGVEEELMNWKQKLESWFAAAAFAEEGERETALHIASTPIPQPKEATKILPSLNRTFAAVAFAEENCHEYATEMLYGVKRRNSFLDVVGLRNARVWYGTALVEETFAEVVGLVGVRTRLMTIRL